MVWYNIFKFEINYRIKRPETYIFFVFLFLFSMVGVDFVFQGFDFTVVKKNAPLIIAKTMGAITGFFMILASMIMGVPVIRDFEYNIESLMFVNPIKKRDYLLGRFLGSFTVLLFIFGGLLFGMMLGSQMSWHKEEEMLFFNALVYFQSFAIIVLPTLFFGACVFFVTGMLDRCAESAKQAPSFANSEGWTPNEPHPNHERAPLIGSVNKTATSSNIKTP